MLSDDALGAFILVLANSRQGSYLKAELETDLEDVFSSLKDRAANGKLEAPKDDLDVFDQLVSADLCNIPVWQSRMVGDWEIACNTIRRLRPARSSSQTFDSIKQPFDDNKFHFNKPFLKPEILWQGEYEAHQLRVLYNKFPFSEYHLLIAVDAQKNFPQVMTQELHQINCLLVNDIAGTLPGFGIGFNSLAAGASVNHMHCQGFIRTQQFPIEDKGWSHNGGENRYPLRVKRFFDVEDSWAHITSLLQQDVAFNCLYRHNGCYVITRKYQGSVDLPEWLSGAGWLDVAGVITVSEEQIFNEIDADTVSRALSLLA